jgi:hypothetical protein
MEIDKLNKTELIRLKDLIDDRISTLDTLKEVSTISKGKNRLIDLQKGDKIFCVDFKGSNLYHIDYVDISFHKDDREERKEWLNYSASHDTKPMGCHSSLKEEKMYNHCFLVEFLSYIKFFTLKPETWEEDLEKEMQEKIILKNKIFNNDINTFTTLINSFITERGNDVDTFVNDLK